MGIRGNTSGKEQAMSTISTLKWTVIAVVASSWFAGIASVCASLLKTDKRDIAPSFGFGIMMP